MALRQGQKIADIGAGGGYFAFKFAEAVGKEGVVYAADTDTGKIEFIRKSAAEKGLCNVQVLADKEGVAFPEKIDLIFLRDVYHHIPNRVSARAKSDGRIVIVENSRSGRFSFHRIFECHVTEETIIEEMTKAGYSVSEVKNFLPKQSFTIFTLKGQNHIV